MLAVAAEQLVGAHPGEDHLDAALARRLAHEQRVDRGRIAYRLVEHVDHAGQQVDDVGRDLDLVQFDAELRRDLPRVDGIVGHGLQPLVLGPEGDRVGVDPWPAWCASTVTMLESRPPDRKLDTGTSDTRCAVDRLLDHRPRSAAGPAAASSATSAMRQ